MRPGVLEVEDLYRAFGSREVLRGISFSVRPGQTYALLGPNGAGKTTTLRIVLGLLDAQRGNVSIDRMSLTRDRARLGREIGFMLEQPRMIPELTLVQNLSFFASIYRMPRPGKQIGRVIRELGLEAWRDVPLSRYSKGMGQKAALGRAILHDPSILILDEPLAGLDPLSQEDFRGRIQRLRGEGKSLLLSSHDLSEVERLCTHVGMLRRGRLLVSGSLDSIRRSSGLSKLRIGWVDPESAARAAASLERHHRVRRDYANPLDLDVIFPVGADPRGLIDRLSAGCRRPAVVTPGTITLEDIFLFRMGRERECDDPAGTNA